MLKAVTLLIALLWCTTEIRAEESNLEHLAQKYFQAKLATQQPNASEADLEAYLDLLSEHVGYEHKPYRLLGEVEGGKQRMRKGMTYYLGKNERYDAELVSIAIGHNAFAIQYNRYACLSPWRRWANPNQAFQRNGCIGSRGGQSLNHSGVSRIRA